MEWSSTDLVPPEEVANSRRRLAFRTGLMAHSWHCCRERGLWEGQPASHSMRIGNEMHNSGRICPWIPTISGWDWEVELYSKLWIEITLHLKSSSHVESNAWCTNRLHRQPADRPAWARKGREGIWASQRETWIAKLTQSRMATGEMGRKRDGVIPHYSGNHPVYQSLWAKWPVCHRKYQDSASWECLGEKKNATALSP